jgi:hypothetical protein
MFFNYNEVPFEGSCDKERYIHEDNSIFKNELLFTIIDYRNHTSCVLQDYNINHDQLEKN